MDNIDFDKLAKDIADGFIIAQKVAAETDDNQGCCNFDSPQFHFGKEPPPELREQYENALRTVKLGFFWCGDIFGKGNYHRLVFGPGCGGQGASRTKAAEAIKKHLETCGYTNVSMYYQMD